MVLVMVVMVVRLEVVSDALPRGLQRSVLKLRVHLPHQGQAGQRERHALRGSVL